ncbi:tetratricopeptide repeat protein [Sphingomonas kaistensis]|uniref:Tetratricopeptide repeat protein n=1 Tax=Sphingomonas kaistensis TaxID=298708 RepID=A0ABZ2G205_9SPHN
MDFLRSGAATFVAARAAADAGDARRAAMLYASLAAADPGDRSMARRALSQAIVGGDMPLALRLIGQQPAAGLPVEAQLLRISQYLQTRSSAKTEYPQQIAFMAPLVGAWILAERRRWKEAVRLLDGVAADAPLAGLVPEQKALILLAAGRSSEAQPFIQPALAAARGRSNRLRIAFATGLAAAGEREAGLTLLTGRDSTLRAAASTLAAERRPRPLIATATQGYSELLTALAVSLDGEEGRSLALSLAQVARYADPRSEQAALLTALLLDRSWRGADALSILRSIPDSSPFAGEMRDAEMRVLLGADRQEEALARARAFVASNDKQAGDWLRLGDVLDAMGRHGEAAAAYDSAVSALQSGGAGPELWSVHLLRGAALEQAGMWPQAESALELAYRLAPENPTVLNYLGYARLERGQKLDEAEALIAEASRRAPDDASITDSLGWAQYKRGKLSQAILTLQRAAAADPAQAEINEHLGDALYAAGRKYEARFAWNAALVTAEDDVATRIAAKIAGGLSPATAAP